MSDAVSAVNASRGLDMYDKVSDMPLSFQYTEVISGSRAKGSSSIRSVSLGAATDLAKAYSAASRHTNC